MIKKPNTRSMIFTLYGDYIRRYGGEIWIGSLIELLEPFDHTEQAVRTAVYRMGKQNWLKNRRETNKSYYSLTEQGIKRMDEAAGRIYRIEPEKWDGMWRLVHYTIPEENRHIRDEFRQELGWSGFGSLFNSVWISPNELTSQVHDMVERYGIEDHVNLFIADNQGPKTDLDIVKQCWDINFINERYEVFIEKNKNRFLEDKERIESGEYSEKDCFVRRTMLVHYYRKSLFIDPGLPKELLPDKWLGEEAAKLFDSYYKMLEKPANVFFERVFAKGYDDFEKLKKQVALK